MTGKKTDEKPPEDTLPKAVSEGRAFNIDDDGNIVKPGVGIDAALIRKLVGGRKQVDGAACVPTPFGIVIHCATINRRVALDNVVGVNGGSIAALEFHKCVLTQGFSGAHGKFSRLCFFDCTFGDPVPEGRNGRRVPTVDLTDAHIDGDLNMEGVAPDGFEPGDERSRDQPPHLWIRAVGAQINGKVELSRCRLRAPPPSEGTPTCDELDDALNLSLATIRGDLWMLCGARCEGRVKLRAAHIGGDVWMSGATIENPGRQALFMQGARVDGLLMMDGRFDQVGNQGRFHRFRCIGDLSLEEGEIGRSLYLRDTVLRGELLAPALSVRNDLVLDGEIAGRIKLEGCRIGGSLDMSRLNLACSARCLSLKDGTIGRSLKLAYARARYRLIEARHAKLASLPGLELIETLWELHEGEKITTDKDVPEDRRLVQAAFLVSHRGRRNAEIFHLDGHLDVLKRAADRFDRKIDRTTAAEYGRLYAAHVLGSKGILRLLGCSPYPELEHEPTRARIDGLDAGFFMASTTDERVGAGSPGDPTFVFEAAGIRDDRLSRWRIVVRRTGRVDICRAPGATSLPLERVPRFRNGLIAVPPLPRHEGNEIVSRAGWLASPALDGMTPYVCPSRLQERLAHHIEWNPLLQAEVDLEGLSCDMLEDHGGGAWGEHLDPIRMNHFVYRRTKWESHDRGEKSKKSSRRRFGDWGRAARADYLGLSMPGRWTRSLREECDYLEPWQVRRNWIYRHFTPSKLRDLISISRYRIPEEKYRSQPFEQAILVARAEGREDYAVRFEMLKSRNEWRLFNARARWWLGPIAITASSAWLFWHSIYPVWTGLAWGVTLPMMVGVSWIDDCLKGGSSWPHLIARFLALYLALLFASFVLVRMAFLAASLDGGNLEAILIAALLALVPMLAVRGLRTWGLRGISAWWPRRAVREFVFYLPAVLLLAIEWWPHPFHYVIAFLIYVGIRSAGVISKFVMGLGFGYLRRPGRAIVTLILAFFLGWWGVHHAIERDMIVIDAASVAEFAGPDRNAIGAGSREVPVLMGSWKVDESPYFARELSCKPELSEGLYALDVLLPLVDLNEESRCDVRRIADPNRHAIDPDRLGWVGLWQAIPGLPLDDHRFWWWAKALYAIAGWFIVSLAILTFAHVNKVHAEPPTEHK